MVIRQARRFCFFGTQYRLLTRNGTKVFRVHGNEKLTAFLELESAIRATERPEGCGGVK
jgi:hypothetical protein